MSIWRCVSSTGMLSVCSFKDKYEAYSHCRSLNSLSDGRITWHVKQFIIS